MNGYEVLVNDIVILEALTRRRALPVDNKIQSKCTHCGELRDDEDCELIQGLVFCGECLNAFDEWGDGVGEEVKQYIS